MVKTVQNKHIVLFFLSIVCQKLNSESKYMCKLNVVKIKVQIGLPECRSIRQYKMTILRYSTSRSKIKQQSSIRSSSRCLSPVSHTPPPAAPQQTVETLPSWPNTRFNHTAHNIHPLSCKQHISSYVETTLTSTAICQTHKMCNTTKNTPYRCGRSFG